MQRINSPDHLFHDGDPFNGVQGTVVTAAFLNTLQEEIAAVVEAAGIQLSSASSTQLLNALTQIFAGLSSPHLVGIPTTPTPAAGDSSTQITNTAWVRAFVSTYLSANASKSQRYFIGQS